MEEDSAIKSKTLLHGFLRKFEQLKIPAGSSLIIQHSPCRGAALRPAASRKEGFEMKGLGFVSKEGGRGRSWGFCL